MISNDEDLKIREELVGLHAAINPFIAHSSSPRGLMSSGHISQIVTIEHGEAQIIQTGLETQFAENTFSCRLEADSRIVAVLRRYNGVSANTVTETAEYTVIAQDVTTGELDVIPIPRFHKLHQQFGFEYKVNEDILNAGIVNTILPKGTILADSPTVSKDKEYRFGVPVNLAYLHVPEVTGDGVILSDKLAKKFEFNTYETIVAEFGEKTFPLNLHGDGDNYKIIPDIGEMVPDDRVVMATREYDPELAPALLSREAVKNYSVNFDKPFYAKSTGGEIVDIKVYSNSKARKSTYTETTDQVTRYDEALIRHYKDILTVYEEQNKVHYAKHRESVPVTPAMQRLLLDAYAATECSRNVRYTNTNDVVDLYRVEITIGYRKIPDLLGYKVTTLHGIWGVN